VEEPRVAVALAADVALDVAIAGAFDLDDVGALVG
jgi:hypothetical protein